MNNDYSITGFLKITVLSGIFLFPVEGAKVTIISEEGVESDVIADVLTDRGGSTGPILLPAFDENYNVPSDPLKPIKTYTIMVTKEGFTQVVQQGIPVFPNIVSEKFVYMIPLPEQLGRGAGEYDNTIYTTETSQIARGDNS